MYHVFCSLCGVVISPYEGPLWPTPKPPLSWDHEMNVVCYPPGENRDRPAISGTGLVGESTFRASFDPNWICYTDVPYEPVGEYDLHRGPDPAAFFFHRACYHLLESRLGAGPGPGMRWDPNALPALMFHLLRCHPKDRHGVPLTHLTCEVSRYRDPYRPSRGGYEGALPGSLLFIMDKPRMYSKPAVSVPTTTKPCWWELPQDRPTTGYSREATDDEDPFAPLPTEIVIQIITQLSSTTICNLRLASGAIARKSLPWDLPQFFWESRVAPDSEMAYFLLGKEATQDREGIDWRALYARARKSLSEDPGFRNKLRIFRCLSHFCPTLEALNNGRTPYLSPVGIPPVDDLLPNGRWAGRRMQTSAPHEYAAQYLPIFYPGAIMGIRLSVSFVVFAGRRYISGFRTKSHADDDTTLREIGVHPVGPVEHIDLSGNIRLAGLRVYTVSEGVVGLEFRSDDREMGSISVGQCSAIRDTDVAAAELHTTVSSRLAGFVATFDVCKCVALQIVETSSSDEDFYSAETSPTPDTASAILWKSTFSPPLTEDIRLARVCSDIRGTPYGRSRVCLNMNFGGPHGERLPLLNRVVALLDMYSGLFKGFEFFYDNDASAACGTRSSIRSAASTRPCVEMSFVVCGRQGERVIEIRVDKATMLGREHVRRLHFLTNMGAHHVFESQGGSYQISSPEPFVVLRPARGCVLTGLVTELTSFDSITTYDGVFGAVGITDSPEEEANQKTSLSDSTLHIIPPEPGVDRYVKREGCWTSTANLQNVSRIRFSTGFQGHARTNQHISGLMFHFRNTERVSVVGQWLKEIESMDIENGDVLSQIRVYYAHKAGRGICLRRNNGKVTRVVVSTAKGVRKEVLRGGCEEMLFSDYYANTLEEMGGLTWSFSHRYDRVQVVNSPRPQEGAGRLRLHCNPALKPQTIHDARRFLWEDTNCNGKEVPLSAIDAFFDPHLSGLKFVYGTIERSVGECRGERRSLSLRPTESITSMDVNMESLVGDVLVLRTDLQQDVIFRHSSTRLETAKGRNFSKYLLDQSSAGIWVVPRPSRPGGPSIRDLGPIFLEN